jgi:hypothetical protein
MDWIRPFVLGFALMLLPCLDEEAQQDKVRQPREQLKFNTEQAIEPIERPLALSEDVMQILRKDDILLRTSKSCLEKGQVAEQIPDSWFVASQVHLDGSHEIDLVVLPKNGCLNGANVGPFWVVQKTSKGCQVVLSGGGHNLEILSTRSKGYRDIQLTSATATKVSTSVFRFDGHRYQIYQAKSEPIK